MSSTPKKYKPYRKRPRRIPLEEEQNLIRLAQGGCKTSASRLVEIYDTFISRVARKIAGQTGAYKNVDDLAQVGRLALYEKIFSYNFNFKCRLTSYAYREITHRMFQEACDYLEIVPLTKKFELHQAHKELDSLGYTFENIKDIAEKYNLSESIVSSLMRITVPMDGLEEEFINYNNPEKQILEKENVENKTSTAWSSLNSAQRMIIAMAYVNDSIRNRAKIFNIKPKELKLLEACAKKTLQDKVIG